MARKSDYNIKLSIMLFYAFLPGIFFSRVGLQPMPYYYASWLSMSSTDAFNSSYSTTTSTLMSGTLLGTLTLGP